jgi:hypothetical protein
MGIATLHQSNTDSESSIRPERVISHALVELRRRSWWPFGIKSAVLLDVSESGFKIEFTGKADYSKGEQLILSIPLTPFGISAPRAISVPVEVVWFDQEKMRCGGVFKNSDPSVALFVRKIMEVSKGI